MAIRGFRNSLLSRVPNWLSNRPSLNTGFKFLYVVALMLDVQLKQAIEGVRSWFPGYVSKNATGYLDPTTALPLIAENRGIIQGETETDAAYAARLIGWLEDWEAAGSSEILAKMIQSYLGNTPTVRIVDRAGNWVSVDSSGNVTKTFAAWNWDSLSNPERAGWWSDLWIIVYPTEWPITGTTLSSLVGIWGNENAATEVGTGHGVPRAALDAILSLVEQWKGAHVWCQAIIWSYDTTLFVPGSPASGDPDGTWGDWALQIGDTWQSARTGANDGRVRYWVPDGG